MNLGFWNIRGCKRFLALEETKDFNRCNKVDVMVLCETKVQSTPFEGSVRHCRFTFCDYIPTIGMAGGICYPFVLKVIFKSSRFIACSIDALSMNCSFIIIFIYAPPNFAAKQEFWIELILYVSSIYMPFLIIRGL